MVSVKCTGHLSCLDVSWLSTLCGSDAARLVMEYSCHDESGIRLMHTKNNYSLVLVKCSHNMLQCRTQLACQFSVRKSVACTWLTMDSL